MPSADRSVARGLRPRPTLSTQRHSRKIQPPSSPSSNLPPALQRERCSGHPLPSALTLSLLDLSPGEELGRLWVTFGISDLHLPSLAPPPSLSSSWARTVGMGGATGHSPASQSQPGPRSPWAAGIPLLQPPAASGCFFGNQNHSVGAS